MKWSNFNESFKEIRKEFKEDSIGSLQWLNELRMSGLTRLQLLLINKWEKLKWDI